MPRNMSYLQIWSNKLVLRIIQMQYAFLSTEKLTCYPNASINLPEKFGPPKPRKSCRARVSFTWLTASNLVLAFVISFYVFRIDCQRMLAQLVSHSGGTPQVMSSTPRGSEFQAEGKKIPSLAPCAKALVVRRFRSARGPLHGPGTVPRGYVSQC